MTQKFIKFKRILSTAVRVLVVARLVILGISPLTLIILAVRV